jgi:hypothetical protein
MLMERSRATAVRLVIELYENHEPIEGVLIDPQMHTSPFRGWLALTTLIDAARGPYTTDSMPENPVGSAHPQLEEH